VVLVFRGSPHTAPAPRRAFEGDGGGAPAAGDEADPWAQHVQDSTKIRAAYDRGAAAVLLFDPDEAPEEGRRRRPSRGDAGAAFRPERAFLALTINERVFRAIVRSDPQETARGLKRRFDALRRDIQAKQTRSFATSVAVTLKGYDQSLRIAQELGNNMADNVLAMIEGSDPDLKQQVILVGAHLDHIGTSGGFVLNGADDNASGSAVVLEVARVLAQGQFQPRRTLVFALWTGEELGLLGSLHYTKQPCAGVTMANIVSSFNLDMVGMGDKLDASGALNFPAIWDVMRRDQDPEIVQMIEPSTGGPGGSDHTGFIRKGIQTVFLMSRGGIGHPDYHQPEDDIERIDAETLRRAGQFVLQAMVNLANETQVNLLVDRRQDLYDALRLRVANFNPQLSGSAWSVVDLKSNNRDELMGQLIEQVQQLGKAAPPPAEGPRMRRAGPPGEAGSGRPTKSLARGLQRMELIGTDVRLLELVAEVYGIGRIDIAADHPFWVADGKLTADGKAMLSAVQERNFVVHLLSPGPELLADVLQSTSKPFVITGDYQIAEELADQITARGILCGVTLDPAAVDTFLTRVEELKSRLGERRNLFAYLAKTDGLDEAKAALYLGLLDRGWGRGEIVSGREHRGVLGGATMETLAR
jgi:hypothetical protein